MEKKSKCYANRYPWWDAAIVENVNEQTSCWERVTVETGKRTVAQKNLYNESLKMSIYEVIS